VLVIFENAIFMTFVIMLYFADS